MVSAYAWVLVRPKFSITEVVVYVGLAAAAWIISGDRPGWNLSILSRLSVILLVIGCTIHSTDLFPERGPVIWFYVPFTVWFATASFKSQNKLFGYLLPAIVLGAAPYTELHLERNPWTLCAALFFLVEVIRGSGLKFRTRELYAMFGFALFIGVVASGVFWSVYPYATIRHLGILLYDWALFAGIILALQNRENRDRFIMFLAALIGTYLIFAFVAVGTRMFHMGIWEGIGLRVLAFSRHPNYVIMPVLLSIPMWFYLLGKTKRLADRVLWFTGLLFSLIYIIVFSYSRQGLVVLGLYGLLGILFFRKTKLWKLFLTGIVLTAGILSFSLIYFRAIFLRVQSIFDLANSLRFNAWKIFWELILDRPILGYGLGTNRYIYPQAFGEFNQAVIPTRQFLFEAHNAYIDIWLGTGIIGLSVFLLFLMFSTVTRFDFKNPDSRYWVMISAAIFIDLFFNYRLHAQDTGVFLTLSWPF